MFAKRKLLGVSRRASNMRKFIALLMLSLMVTTQSSIARAEEAEDGDYVELAEGEVAPYDGYLFHDEAISALIVKQDKEKAEIKLDAEAKLASVKIELSTEIKKKDAELAANKELSEKLLKLNKEELGKLQGKLERVSWVAPALFVVGFLAGSYLTLQVAQSVSSTLR